MDSQKLTVEDPMYLYDVPRSLLEDYRGLSEHLTSILGLSITYVNGEKKSTDEIDEISACIGEMMAAQGSARNSFFKKDGTVTMRIDMDRSPRGHADSGSAGRTSSGRGRAPLNPNLFEKDGVLYDSTHYQVQIEDIEGDEKAEGNEKAAEHDTQMMDNTQENLSGKTRDSDNKVEEGMDREKAMEAAAEEVCAELVREVLNEKFGVVKIVSVDFRGQQLDASEPEDDSEPEAIRGVGSKRSRSSSKGKIKQIRPSLPLYAIGWVCLEEMKFLDREISFIAVNPSLPASVGAYALYTNEVSDGLQIQDIMMTHTSVELGYWCPMRSRATSDEGNRVISAMVSRSVGYFAEKSVATMMSCYVQHWEKETEKNPHHASIDCRCRPLRDVADRSYLIQKWHKIREALLYKPDGMMDKTQKMIKDDASRVQTFLAILRDNVLAYHSSRIVV